MNQQFAKEELLRQGCGLAPRTADSGQDSRCPTWALSARALALCHRVADQAAGPWESRGDIVAPVSLRCSQAEGT